MKTILLLISIAAFAACGAQDSTPPKANQVLKATNDSSNSALANASPAANVSPNSSPNAAPTNAADKSKIKTYDGTGAVTKINLELGSIELKHEEIKGLMPAMQMEFYVSDKKMLGNLEVGDAVNFVLEDNAGAEQIISVKKSQVK